MKIFLLGNDTKKEIDGKIKDYFAKKDLCCDDFTSCQVEFIDSDGQQQIILRDNNNQEVPLKYEEFLADLESIFKEIKDAKRMQIVATAGMLSRAEGRVSDVYKKRQKYASNVKVASNVVGYGHKTIAEHDYYVLALEDVTPIVEQTLIGYRLTSFTIKSRRNVDFRNVGFYVPDFKDKNGQILTNNDHLKDIYVKYMKSLFVKYGEFVDSGIPVEDSRFILPYCYYSNIVMGCDANELLRITSDLLYGKLSNITELKELGGNLARIICENSPYLAESLKQESKRPYYEDKYAFVDTLLKRFDDKAVFNDYYLLDKVHLNKNTINPDSEIICSFLKAKYQITNEKAIDYVSRMDDETKQLIMQAILHSKNNRELEQVNFQFEIPIDLATLTHLTRHRMQSLLVPDFVPMWNLNNYVKPQSVMKEYESEYVQTFSNNKLMMEYFKRQGVRDEDLVYFYLSGNMCNVYTNMNGRELVWFSKMRCCNKAQWPIRKIANQMVADVRKVSPLLAEGLGPSCMTEHYCPEGKDSCKNRGIVVLKKELTQN